MMDKNFNLLEEQLAESGLEMSIDPGLAFGISAGLQAIGIGSSIFGGAQADANERKAVKKQNKYNKKVWRYEQREANRQYEYRKEGLAIQKQNYYDELAYKEATASRQYEYDQAIQDYRYQLALREYEKSEENYKQQLGFNNLAAAEAYESEQRAFNEIMNAQAFQREDLMFDKVSKLGQAKLLQAGRSSSRAQSLSLAQIGRTIGRLDESFRSARTESMASMRDIELRKYGADLQAFNARKIRPEELPGIPKPLELPRAQFQDVYKPGETPEPVKGVAYGGNMLAAIGGSLQSAANVVASAPSFFNAKPSSGDPPNPLKPLGS